MSGSTAKAHDMGGSDEEGRSVGESVELVIFDCDGVLVDSEVISARVGARVLTDLGWAVVPEELIRRFAGCTEQYWRTTIEAELGRALEPGWEAPYRSWYEDAFDAELLAIPGVASAIRSLDVPYCVASNGSHEKIRINLRRTGLLDDFGGRIFSAQDVPQGKPAPDLFLHAAEVMGVSPHRCVVVEDTPTGLTAARAAGMRCLAYAAGLIPVDRLEGPHTTVFDDMTRLPELLRMLAA